MKIPSISDREGIVPLLIVPSTEYSKNVPVIIGTNLITLVSKQSMTHFQMNGKMHSMYCQKHQLERLKRRRRLLCYRCKPELSQALYETA